MALRPLEYWKNDVILGGYPWELLFAHSIRAHTSWRTSMESDPSYQSTQPKWTYSIVAAFFCHGFGGSFFRDIVTGQAPSVFTNPDLPSAWLASFLLVNYSPFDMVYKRASKPCTLLSLTLTAYEAIDSCGTILGSYEKALSLFPNSAHSGIVAGLVAATGGANFRYVERRFGRRQDGIFSEYFRPTATLRLAVIYIAVYTQLRKAFGVDQARVSVMSFHLLWQLLQELLQRKLDFTRAISFML